MEVSKEQSGKSSSGFTRSEVAGKLKPAISLHGIEVKDDHIEFPCTGTAEFESSNGNEVIRFTDITSIEPFENRIEVLMLSGDLYVFSTTEPVRTRINTHKPGADTVSKHRSTTARDIADNIWNSLDDSLSGKGEKK